MPREIHALRLPRLVVGTVARGREVERVAVHDEVSVAIEVLDPRATAVAWREQRGDGTRYVAREGVPYGPLDHARPGEPDTPEGMWPDLAERIASEAGIGERHTGQRQARLADWAAELGGASRRRGLVAEGAIRFRSIEDDGRAAQSALAARIGTRLALLDGRLYHKACLPRVRVACDGEAVHLFDAHPAFPLDGDGGEPLGFEDFRLDRREDAHAYRDAAIAEFGLRDLGGTNRRLEIVDAGALRACYDRAGSEQDLAAIAVADGLRRALSPAVGALPDGVVARYLALRAGVAGRDAAALRGLLAESDAFVEALAAVSASREAELAAEAVQAVAAILLRHRRIDLPGLHREADDAALADLAQGLARLP